MTTLSKEMDHYRNALRLLLETAPICLEVGETTTIDSISLHYSNERHPETVFIQKLSEEPPRFQATFQIPATYKNDYIPTSFTIPLDVSIPTQERPRFFVKPDRLRNGKCAYGRFIEPAEIVSALPSDSSVCRTEDERPLFSGIRLTPLQTEQSGANIIDVNIYLPSSSVRQPTPRCEKDGIFYFDLEDPKTIAGGFYLELIVDENGIGPRELIFSEMNVADRTLEIRYQFGDIDSDNFVESCLNDPYLLYTATNSDQKDQVVPILLDYLENHPEKREKILDPLTEAFSSLLDEELRFAVTLVAATDCDLLFEEPLVSHLLYQWYPVSVFNPWEIDYEVFKAPGCESLVPKLAERAVMKWISDLALGLRTYYRPLEALPFLEPESEALDLVCQTLGDLDPLARLQVMIENSYLCENDTGGEGRGDLISQLPATTLLVALSDYKESKYRDLREDLETELAQRTDEEIEQAIVDFANHEDIVVLLPSTVDYLSVNRELLFYKLLTLHPLFLQKAAEIYRLNFDTIRSQELVGYHGSLAGLPIGPQLLRKEREVLLEIDFFTLIEPEKMEKLPPEGMLLLWFLSQQKHKELSIKPMDRVGHLYRIRTYLMGVLQTTSLFFEYRLLQLDRQRVREALERIEAAEILPPGIIEAAERRLLTPGGVWLEPPLHPETKGEGTSE